MSASCCARSCSCTARWPSAWCSARRSFSVWLALTAAGASVALPAVLLWLLVICGLKQQLARSPLPAAVDGRRSCSAAPPRSRVAPDRGPAARCRRGRPRRARRLGPGARRRGDGGGDLPVAAPAAPRRRCRPRRRRAWPSCSRASARTSSSTRSTPRSRSCASTRPRPRACSRTWPSCSASRSPRAPSRSRSARRSTSRSATSTSSRSASAAACTSRWELDAQAATARVPPLLLQPLVENAVRHGVEPSAEGGVIRVRTKVKLGRARGVDRQQRAEGAVATRATAWR